MKITEDIRKYAAEQAISKDEAFHLVPKVSEALWERTQEAKLCFGGGRVSIGAAIKVVVRRMGDGVTPGRAFPKRCANFGNEGQTRGKKLTQAIR